MGVDATGVRRAVIGERVNVSRFKFCGLPVVQNVLHNRMSGRERGEGLFVGFKLASFRLLGLFDELHFSEEDFSELFGRVEIEGASGRFFDLLT